VRDHVDERVVGAFAFFHRHPVADVFDAVLFKKADGVVAEAGEQVVRLLLEAGADADERDAFQKTPLCYAVDPRVIWALLAAGARADAPGPAGKTPLHLLAQRGLSVVVRRILYAGGIDSGARTLRGETPEDMAAPGPTKTVFRQFRRDQVTAAGVGMSRSCLPPDVARVILRISFLP
jgi:ankyrin repeat protein